MKKRKKKPQTKKNQPQIQTRGVKLETNKARPKKKGCC